MSKVILFFVFLSSIICAAKLSARPYPALENAYIMGYERREAEYFDEVAAIAQEIHGHHGVPVPERKPRYRNKRQRHRT